METINGEEGIGRELLTARRYPFRPIPVDDEQMGQGHSRMCPPERFQNPPRSARFLGDESAVFPLDLPFFHSLPSPDRQPQSSPRSPSYFFPDASGTTRPLRQKGHAESALSFLE